MGKTFKNGLKSYRLLFDFTDYTRWELVLKWLILPVFMVLNTFLFLSVGLFYLIERLFAVVFRFFIAIQSKILKHRALSEQAFKKVFTLLSVIVFIIFLPFILIYYLAMLFKYFGKTLMKNLIVACDFSNVNDRNTLFVFDDAGAIHPHMRMSGMMKDFSNIETVGKSFEQMLNQLQEDDEQQ